MADTFADPSPDGKPVAFVRADADAERIYIATAGSDTARRLTSSRGTLPRWSPDGSAIVFARDRRPDGGISVIRADGSGERQLTKDGGWPVWWPDGSQIAYLAARADGNGEIRVVSLRNGAIRSLESVRVAGLNHPFALFRGWFAARRRQRRPPVRRNLGYGAETVGVLTHRIRA